MHSLNYPKTTTLVPVNDTVKGLKQALSYRFFDREAHASAINGLTVDSYLPKNEFRYGIIDKAAPGIFTRTVRGTLTDEDIAYILAKPETLKTLINVLRAKNMSLAQDILAILSPNASATATVYAHAKIFTPESIHQSVFNVITRKGGLGVASQDDAVMQDVASVLTTLLIRFLKPLDLVLDTLPIIEFEDRYERIPDFNNLVNGLIMAAVEQIFKTLNFDVTNAYKPHAAGVDVERGRAEKRASLMVYAQGFQRMMTQLAIDLTTISAKRDFIISTLGYIRDWFVRPSKVHDYPVSLAANASFRGLVSNLTLVQVALSEDVIDAPVNWDFAVEKCIEEFRVMLDQSKRFTVVTLDELISGFSHRVISDNMGRPKAVLVAQNYVASAQLQGFTFERAFASWSNDTMLPTSQKQATNAFSSILAGATQSLSGQHMLEQLHSLLSLSERFNNSEEILVLNLLTNERELLYYAAHMAESVNVYNVWLDGKEHYELAFSVPFKKMNYVPMTGLAPDGIVETFDPAELLLFVDERDATSQISSKEPLIADQLKDNFLLPVINVKDNKVDIERFSRVKSKLSINNIAFDNGSVSATIDINRSLGLPIDEDYAFHMLAPRIDAMLWSAQFALYLSIDKMLAKMITNDSDKELPEIVIHDSVATSFVSLLQLINDTPFISTLTNSVMRKVKMLTLNGNNVANTHLLTTRSFAYSMRTLVSLQMLYKAGLITYETVTKIVDEFATNQAVQSKIVNMIAQNLK